MLGELRKNEMENKCFDYIQNLPWLMLDLVVCSSFQNMGGGRTEWLGVGALK